MLAVVLAGIGLGSIVSSLIQTVSCRAGNCCRAPASRASATLLSIFFSSAGSSTEPSRIGLAFSQQVGCSLALMFPVAFLSGAFLPAIATVVQSEMTGRMNSTGLTILFNTIGAAVGSLVAGFLLLPRLGSSRA
jgi:predicted membrane-bound spermidine synthase